MHLSVTTTLAIYFILWWVVLFAVLPFGVRSPEADDVSPGTDPGAPMRARLGLKLIITTVVTAIIFGIAYAFFASGIVSFDKLEAILPG